MTTLAKTMKQTISRITPVKWVKLAVAVVAVTGICLLISGKGLLYGQAPDARIPDMIGVWDGEVDGCLFDDVRSTEYEPQCFENVPFEPFRITHQTGRVFAGRAGDPEFQYAAGRYTGVVLPDGSVRMQQFEQSELRLFFTGKLKVTDGRYELVGHGDLFDDLTEKTSTESGNMATFIIRLTKLY